MARKAASRTHHVQLTADLAFRNRVDYELDCQEWALGRRPHPAQMVGDALRHIRYMHGAELAALIGHLDLSVAARAGVVMVAHPEWGLAEKLALRFTPQTPGRLGVTWSPRVVIIGALFTYSRTRTK